MPNALGLPARTVVAMGEKTTWAVTGSAVLGKHPDSRRCEDLLVVTASHAAVIDGATDKTGLTYLHEGTEVSSGRFAALVVANALRSLDPTLSPPAATAALSHALDAAVAQQRPNLAVHERPAASVVVLPAHRAAVVGRGREGRLGDRDGAVHEVETGKRIDDIATGMRCAYLAARAASGSPRDPTGADADPGRTAILPLLALQGALGNTTGSSGTRSSTGRPCPPSSCTAWTCPRPGRSSSPATATCSWRPAAICPGSRPRRGCAPRSRTPGLFRDAGRH